MNTRKKDKIYSSPLAEVADFEFDSQVADVFADMINRSVPGYGNIINLLGSITKNFAQENSYYYDLGCSLGACTLAMRQQLDNIKNCQLIGVDTSEAMIERAKNYLTQDKNKTPYKLICDDINNIEITNAAMVIMNFTLQFIDNTQRTTLLEKVYNGLHNNGAFILSEKITFDDHGIQKLQTDLHHEFKRQQGYSQLEISQKRNAIEQVLIPDSMHDHTDRLKTAGFELVFPWFQNFNFVSILAVKQPK